MVKDKIFLSKITLCASLFAFVVIALGAYTRLMDAGLGCPDWPGCYGHMVVPMTDAIQQSKFANTPLVAYKAWVEMIHRYFAGGLSLLIITVVACVLFRKSCRNVNNIILAGLLLLLLIYQIILGQLTVTLKLLPVIVSQHLLAGFAILPVLWLVHLNNNARPMIEINKPKYVLLLAILGVVFLILQIASGAWTSTNYASLSCPDFPFCINNQFTMSLDFKKAFNLFLPAGVNYDGGVLTEAVRQTIQVTHRLGAFILTLYLFGFVVFAMTQLKQCFQLMRLLCLLLGLLLLQVCFGIANVIFKLPLVTAISHTVIAATLLLTLMTFIYKLATTKKHEALRT